MNPAIQVLLKKRNKAATWNLQAKHPGQVHFEMEKAGSPSRWNTLRAMRVLKHFATEDGLVHNSNTSVYDDRAGHIWIGDQVG